MRARESSSQAGDSVGVTGGNGPAMDGRDRIIRIEEETSIIWQALQESRLSRLFIEARRLRLLALYLPQSSAVACGET